MKNNLQEELNRMKYLLNVERGKLISESEIKKTFLSEQVENTFTLDFSQDSSKSTDFKKVIADNVEYKGKKYEILFSKKATRFLGRQETERVKPYSYTKKDIQPGIVTPQVSGESFRPNFITPSEEAISNLKESAKKIVDSVVQIINEVPDKKKALDYIKKYVNKGYQLIGHADGSVPIERNIRRTDHGKLGLYGGNKKPYDKNTWLAKKRAENSYRYFYNELNNLMNERVEDLQIIDTVVNAFKLTPDKLKIVNHLNPDGTTNPSEIGPQFRKMEFISSLMSVDIPVEKKIEGSDKETVIIPGTEEGEISLPTQEGGSKKVEGIQIQDPAIAAGLWYGVPQEVYDKLIKIGPTTFDGKQKVEGQIESGQLIIDDVSFGYLNELSSNTKGLDVLNVEYVTNSTLCADDTASPYDYNGTKYYPVAYYMCSFNRL